MTIFIGENGKIIETGKMDNSIDSLVDTLEEISNSIDDEFGKKVVLYNDDWHTFEDVTFQLIKAINCSEQYGHMIAWTIHTKGKADIYEGEYDECKRIASILREIQLNVEIKK